MSFSNLVGVNRMNVQNVTRNLPCRMSHQIEVWYSAQQFRSGIKLELAKYYKDSEMTAFISKRSRNSK